MGRTADHYKLHRPTLTNLPYLLEASTQADIVFVVSSISRWTPGESRALRGLVKASSSGGAVGPSGEDSRRSAGVREDVSRRHPPGG